MMNAIIAKYNNVTESSINYITQRDSMDIPCKARYISSGANGKFPEDDVGKNIIIEYSQFIPLISDYLPG
jgi:hypothetical protein